MNNELKQTNAELTESELTQVSGGSMPDHLNPEPLGDGDSVTADETATEPKKPILAWW